MIALLASKIQKESSLLLISITVDEKKLQWFNEVFTFSTNEKFVTMAVKVK